jgi:hypothetical protein
MTMPSLPEPISINEIAIPTIQIETLHADYDEGADMLSVHFGWPRPAICIPLSDDEPEFYLRVDPATKTVVGFQIDYFATAFVKEHPELQPVAGIFRPSPQKKLVMAIIDWLTKWSLTGGDHNRPQRPMFSVLGV